MKRWVATLSVFAAVLITGCAGMMSEMGGWTTLLDGSNPSTLENWNRIGDANWRVVDGAVVANAGKGGSLVTKNSYKDFQIRAEFFVDATTNSGIYVRGIDPNKLGSSTSYEVNINDERLDGYGTGAITGFAKVSPMPKAAGKWSTLLVTAKGNTIVVELNGAKTVELNDSKFAQGSIGLQYGADPKATGGAIKWRKVQIKPL